MKENSIFIHIPRTAGRSIMKALGIEYESMHKSIRQYIRDYTEPVVRNKLKFSVVRNPWDQAASYWAKFRQDVPTYGWEFSPWIQYVAYQRPPMVMPLDQLDYCKNDSGEILIDYFLKYENLEEDFKPIANIFGIQPELPRIGEDERQWACVPKDYRKLYDTQGSIDAVASMNEELIKRFNYTF